MMPTRFILLLTLFLGGYCQFARAQNLVPNPSFEEYHECPSFHSMFHTIDHWTAPNRATTDYLNKCSIGNVVSIPNNYFGNQPARTGNAYAGIHPYETGYNYREYVQVQLIQPLQAGETYHVEFYVSLSSVFNTSISNLGAYLSVDAPSSDDYSLLNNVVGSPQIRNPAGNLLTDTLNWTKIRGVYKAKGGEQFITIGNFDDDDHTELLASPTSPTLSYYYIDDVSVSTCSIETYLGPDRVICANDTFTLDATSPDATYRWQDGSKLPTFQVKGPGTYWVDVKDANCSYRDTVQVDLLKNKPLHTEPVFLCPNQTILLNAYREGATKYRWQDGSTNLNYPVSQPGVYWVDIQFANCTIRDTMEVKSTFKPLPYYNQLCRDQSLILDVSIDGSATYTWTDGFKGPIRTVDAPGYYQVEIQTPSCSFYQSTEVLLFQSGLQPLVAKCPDQTRRLETQLPDALSYRWQDGSTASFFNATEPGIYWVDIQMAHCTFRDSVVVVHLDTTKQNVLKDTYVCPGGGGTLLNAAMPGAVQYWWSNGSYGSYTYVYQPGTYWVEVDLGGCTFRDSVVVTGPVSNLASFYSFCSGQQSVLLDATVNEPATYLWSDGSTQPTLRVNQAGYYSVMVQTSDCSFYLFTQVNDFYRPEIFYEEETFVCRGQQLVLNPNNYNYFNGPFLWQDGSTNATFLVDQPGLYWVEILWNNCTIRDSIRVRFSDIPPPILPATLSLCAGQSYTLDASSVPGPYYWQDGSWQSAIQVNKPGTYWVEYYWNGCLVKSFTEVKSHPQPDFDLTDADLTLCYGLSRVLEMSGKNMAFRWQDGSSGSQYTIRKAGDYWVESHDLTTGCTERKTYHIESVECWTDFYIPNIITPNGDEDNQYFVIEGITDHWGLEIFNRLGNRVYQTAAYANNWEARDQPVGLYYYHLRNPYSGQSYKGWLQVLR
jgi:hypothetical protein